MSELLEKIALCVERGKINKSASYPPDLKDQDGADELAQLGLSENVEPSVLLDGCMLGMQRIGEKFSNNQVFVPELLMAAKAMNAVMQHLKPYFQSGQVRRKGAFVIGTVSGDLHDIGKNLVSMSVEGAGWEVIDLGVDVPADKFIESIEQHPDCAIGLSALLTTTMVNMESIVKGIREKHPSQKILIGGAPVTDEYCKKIGADFYSSDPQGAVIYLSSLVATN
jgi:methanogenic corrinoid protein MtbC1